MWIATTTSELLCLACFLTDTTRGYLAEADVCVFLLLKNSDKHCKGDYLKAKGNYDELPKKWKDQISSWYCEEEEDNNHRD